MRQLDTGRRRAFCTSKIPDSISPCFCRSENSCFLQLFVRGSGACCLGLPSLQVVFQCGNMHPSRPATQLFWQTANMDIFNFHQELQEKRMERSNPPSYTSIWNWFSKFKVRFLAIGKIRWLESWGARAKVDAHGEL